MDWKKPLGATLGILVVVAVIWGFFIVQFESPLGTDNVVEIQRSESLTNDSNDTLATLSFAEGGEHLDWASTEIIVKVGNQQFPCSFGSILIGQTNASKVSPTLSADGVTFTTEIDATDEDSFTHFNISTQRGSESNYSTLRFSKTDIYFAQGIDWTFIADAEFNDVSTTENLTFSNDTNERLDWYTYDIVAHRVEPNQGVYVIQIGEESYKIQFLSYYNQDDEGRHPTMLIGALEDTTFPALSDSTFVAPSPCIILSEHPESMYWNASDYVVLAEQQTNICSQECDMELFIFHETMQVETRFI